MKSIMFFLQYLFCPRKIGAVLPSSDYLAEKMIETVEFQSAKYIVEYGAGTGVFTDKIIKYRRPDTVVMLFESNKVFYETLKEKYKSENNLIIINDTAENIDKYVKKYEIPYIDYVISGLPFASLPQNVSNVILNKTRKLLKNRGEFITFQYTLFKKALFNQYFEQINIKREYRNIPPAFVLCCQN
ncbi:rRNA adenine N-6-methyltransferase family protein [Neobacillus sp. OS1-32]|uniref:class I SAM-dependent methyltransferase n=1 Tax=Neobacillus sp. OS1-32 TaxID=3070682 RepID=UPI0027E09C8B|nr:rRNA adenine N-6-methyltransferase family protein [Neobacillus sp. OS1-32]WML29336.1 rRNA adenine N-6-methyltransferase family protein [Neobacillus sp. OS1-32]